MNYNSISVPCVSLGDCKSAYTTFPDPGACIKQEGITPMAYDTKINSAAATIVNAQSDESRQRDYLLEEFHTLTKYSWQDSKFETLKKQFNINAPEYPLSSQALIDAFAGGKFTVDQKKVDANTKFFSDTDSDDPDGYCDDYVASRFYGITFTGLPVADLKGYEAAVAAYEKAKVDTKRTIIVSSPADGLKALLALEAWTYTAPTA